jgi:diguanylate cyclase (GGDEF)-like protein/PAS domain S-box-containing protein
MTRDSVGVITSVDESIVEMLGWRPEQLVGSPSTTFLHPEDQASGIATWLDMITAPGSTRVWRGRYQTADGLWKWVQTVNRLEDSDNPVVVSLMTPVTMEQAGVEEDLRAREQLLSRLSDALPVGLFQIDVTGNVTFTNDRLHSIVGVPPTATIDAQMSTVVATDRPILQAAVAAVLADQAVDDVEIRLHLPAEVPAEVSADVSAANEERVCLLSLRALTDGSGIVSGAVGCLSDVTDRVHLRQELELRASVDKLTSCLNRAATLELLERTIRTAGMAGEGSAVVFIDLDGFKSVNDRFGHAAGDSLLVAAADRLRGAVRDCDQVGRLGGDEFLVICPGVKSSAQAIRLADRVAAAITATIDVGPVAVELRASVGVAWTTEALDADMFIARADSAMYESKRTHGGGVTLFTPSSDDASPTGERQPARSRRRAVTTGRSNPPSR